jgi:ElaB/YqjD/DUF883 family membrane-anchored ribosome-binding protein
MVKRADDMNMRDDSGTPGTPGTPGMPGRPGIPGPGEPFEWNSGAASDRIRANIDRTRARMDETVDELQSRMSLEHFARSSLEVLRDGSAVAARKAGRIVRDHPIPSAVVAAGVVWMIMRKRRGRRLGWHNGEEDVYGESVGISPPPAEGVVRQRMHDVKERVKHASSAVKEKAQTVGSTLAHAATDAGHYARDTATRFGHSIQHGTQQGRDWFAHTLDEHPLTVAAAFFTIGLAAGLAAPPSRKEDRLLGGLRDDLVDRAQSAGADLIHQGEQVAERAVTAAREAVMSETGGSSPAPGGAQTGTPGVSHDQTY